MKHFMKIAALSFLGAALLGGTAVRAHAEELAPACKGAYLCDQATGTAVYGKNETEHRPIASMCKIMTLLLTFEEIDKGGLTFEEEIPVSERAQGMGGSQVFLQAGLSYRAEDLMRTVAVCSANDSCVALAERVAGSETSFVDRMNERARELGASETLFSNCTGLPKEPQYSCARDVAIMLRALLTHEKYFELCKTWTEEFAHPDGRTTLITNTNKLIRTYSGCDGGKTGFTNEAGFCLAATAKRGETRVIAVVIGAESSKERFSEVSSMLDYAFSNYETRAEVKKGEVLRAEVRGSKVKEIPVCAQEEICIFAKKGEKADCSVEYTLFEDLRAPIQRGEKVGCAVLYKNGVETGRTDLVAGEDALRYSWWDAYRESARNWN